MQWESNAVYRPPSGVNVLENYYLPVHPCKCQLIVVLVMVYGVRLDSSVLRFGVLMCRRQGLVARCQC